MAVHGFSIFLGFIPMFIFALIFVTLFTFKKYRQDYRVYYDAMFCGCMCVYMAFYYAAFNYPESVDSVGSRNLLACILIVMAVMGFLIAALSWMTAAAFWIMIKIKSDQEPVNNPGAGRDTTARGVTFSEDVDEPQRQRFYRNVNNKIMFMVVVATVSLPLLYIIIDIFKGTDADLINTNNRCWVGGPLMYVFIFIPACLATVLSIGLYVWAGTIISPGSFFKLSPDDPLIRNTQLRVILVLGFGVWWLIEIPALAKYSATVIQHFKGLIYIPLSILAYYVFVVQTEGIYETWDEHFPLGVKIRDHSKVLWKYNVKRPVQKRINSQKTRCKRRSRESSATLTKEIEVPTPDLTVLHMVAPDITVTPPPADMRYDINTEFYPESTYQNEEIAQHNDVIYEDDLIPAAPPVSSLPKDYQADYDNTHDSPLYIDPAADAAMVHERRPEGDGTFRNKEG